MKSMPPLKKCGPFTFLLIFSSEKPFIRKKLIIWAVSEDLLFAENKRAHLQTKSYFSGSRILFQNFFIIFRIILLFLKNKGNSSLINLNKLAYNRLTLIYEKV